MTSFIGYKNNTLVKSSIYYVSHMCIVGHVVVIIPD